MSTRTEFVSAQQAHSQLTTFFGNHLKNNIVFRYDTNTAYLQSNYVPSIVLERVQDYGRQIDNAPVGYQVTFIEFQSPINVIIHYTVRNTGQSFQQAICLSPFELYEFWFTNNDKQEELSAYVNNSVGDDSFKQTSALKSRIDELLIEKQDLLNESMRLESEVESLKTTLSDVNRDWQLDQDELKKVLKLLIKSEQKQSKGQYSDEQVQKLIKITKKQDKLITNFREQVASFERNQDDMERKLGEAYHNLDTIETAYKSLVKGSTYEEEYNELKRRMRIIVEVANGETSEQKEQSSQTKVNSDEEPKETYVWARKAYQPPRLYRASEVADWQKTKSEMESLPVKKRPVKQVQKTLHYFYGYGK